MKTVIPLLIMLVFSLYVSFASNPADSLIHRINIKDLGVYDVTDVTFDGVNYHFKLGGEKRAIPAIMVISIDEKIINVPKEKKESIKYSSLNNPKAYFLIAGLSATLLVDKVFTISDLNKNINQLKNSGFNTSEFDKQKTRQIVFAAMYAIITITSLGLGINGLFVQQREEKIILSYSF